MEQRRPRKLTLDYNDLAADVGNCTGLPVKTALFVSMPRGQFMTSATPDGALDRISKEWIGTKLDSKRDSSDIIACRRFYRKG